MIRQNHNSYTHDEEKLVLDARPPAPAPAAPAPARPRHARAAAGARRLVGGRVAAQYLKARPLLVGLGVAVRRGVVVVLIRGNDDRLLLALRLGPRLRLEGRAFICMTLLGVAQGLGAEDPSITADTMKLMDAVTQGKIEPLFA